MPIKIKTNLLNIIDKSFTYTVILLLMSGIFDNEVIFFGLPMDNLNFAFIAGSSKQGKARLASVGWN